MATLAEAVDAAETDWLVSADIPDAVDYLTVESEVVQVTATFPAQYQARDGSTSAPRIRVVRAAGGTTAASHADGTTLTPLIPPSAASGGAAEPGTVVLSDPGLVPDAVAGLEGANAMSGANPVATLDDIPAKDFYASDTDPGAVGFGSVWKDTLNGYWWTRNTDNDAWLPDLSVYVDGGSAANAEVRRQAAASGTRTAYADTSALTEGSGAASATTAAVASGDGNADASVSATIGGAGTASLAVTAAATGGSVGMNLIAEAAGGRLSFNDAVPIARPEIPATPDAQDIADVLVALGLVTQAV